MVERSSTLTFLIFIYFIEKCGIVMLLMNITRILGFTVIYLEIESLYDLYTKYNGHVDPKLVIYNVIISIFTILLCIVLIILTFFT